MFTKEMIQKARFIASHLDVPENYGCDECDGSFDTSELYWQVKKVCPDEDISVDNGISKVVIVLNDDKFVIKIPFNGLYYYPCEYNEETDEYEDGDGEFDPFHVYDDYCDHELDLVRSAQERGFSQFVLDTQCIYEDKFGRKYYIQEKARTNRECYGITTTPVSDHSRDVAASMKKPYACCDEGWRAAVVELYGENTWRVFVDWDKAEELGILSDMHGGNYGYREDGSPVLIDISGFYENDSWD